MKFWYIYVVEKIKSSLLINLTLHIFVFCVVKYLKPTLLLILKYTMHSYSLNATKQSSLKLSWDSLSLNTVLQFVTTGLRISGPLA
jgi:hypothetical protein